MLIAVKKMISFLGVLISKYFLVCLFLTINNVMYEIMVDKLAIAIPKSGNNGMNIILIPAFTTAAITVVVKAFDVCLEPRYPTPIKLANAEKTVPIYNGAT